MVLMVVLLHVVHSEVGVMVAVVQGALWALGTDYNGYELVLHQEAVWEVQIHYTIISHCRQDSDLDSRAVASRESV